MEVDSKAEHVVIPNEWWVVLPLWTTSGMSDLSLEALVSDDGEQLGIEVLDVHVM